MTDTYSLVAIAALNEVGITTHPSEAYIESDEEAMKVTPQVALRAVNLARKAEGNPEYTFDEFVAFLATRPCNHWWLAYHDIEVPA